jgi:nitroreductase
MLPPIRLNLSVDDVLSTTRTVRKRLDVSKPVPRALIDECLELALQAPNGINQNSWRWIVVDDPVKVAMLGALYKSVVAQSSKALTAEVVGVPGEDKILESARSLLDKIERVPALLIPLVAGRPEGKSAPEQAALYGSIIQATWSFFLALRERGLGSAWLSAGTRREKQAAEILGIPMDRYTQIGWFPIAYTIGTTFKKAWRKPVSEVRSYNEF